MNASFPWWTFLLSLRKEQRIWLVTFFVLCLLLLQLHSFLTNSCVSNTLSFFLVFDTLKLPHSWFLIHQLSVADDGRNIPPSFRVKFCSASHGSNSCSLCIIWWFVFDLFANTLWAALTLLPKLLIWSMSTIFEALQFTPHLKGVLARVVPILGNVRDIHRPIFANGNRPQNFLCSNRSNRAFSCSLLAK